MLIPFSTVSLCLASPDLSISSSMWLSPWTKHLDGFFSLLWAELCFPVVPVRISHGIQLSGPIQWRPGVLGRLLSLRGARVQKWRWFFRVEGPAIMIWPRWTCWSVVWHPPEILKRTVSSLVVVGTEVVRTSSFGV